MKFSAGGGALRFSPFIVRCCEESFEVNPSFLLSGKTLSRLCSSLQRGRSGRRVEGDIYDLFKAVWTVAGGGVISVVFEPVEEGFN